MSGAAELPPPAPTPPSLSEAVNEYLDVIHEVRELRGLFDTIADQQKTTATALTSLASNVGRQADAQCTDSITLQRLERRVTSVEQKVDTLLRVTMAVAKHLGVPHG